MGKTPCFLRLYTLTCITIDTDTVDTVSVEGSQDSRTPDVRDLLHDTLMSHIIRLAQIHKRINSVTKVCKLEWTEKNSLLGRGIESFAISNAFRFSI